DLTTPIVAIATNNKQDHSNLFHLYRISVWLLSNPEFSDLTLPSTTIGTSFTLHS
ncbi:25704_t:CDS:1, partial [Gigaspora rosea]